MWGVKTGLILPHGRKEKYVGVLLLGKEGNGTVRGVLPTFTGKRPAW